MVKEVFEDHLLEGEKLTENSKPGSEQLVDEHSVKGAYENKAAWKN